MSDFGAAQPAIRFMVQQRRDARTERQLAVFNESIRRLRAQGKTRATVAEQRAMFREVRDDLRTPEHALSGAQARGSRSRRSCLNAAEKARVTRPAKVSEHADSEGLDNAARHLMRSRGQKVFTREQLESRKLSAAEVQTFIATSAETIKELAG